MAESEPVNLEAMSDAALAQRAFFLALMAIDAKQKGIANPYVEESFPALTAEITRREQRGTFLK